MANLYTQQGIDFDNWFQPGSGNQELSIVDDTGQDIGYKYAAGSGGAPVAWYAPNGTDLNQHFAGYGYGLYRVGGYPWNYRSGDNDSTEYDYWKSWLKQWQTKKYSVKSVAGIMDDCWYRAVDSDYDYSCCIFAWSPYSGEAVNFSYSQPNIARSKSKYSVSMMYLEISPYLKGVVIVPHCGAGKYVIAEVRVTMSQTGQATYSHNGVYGIDNDDNHDRVAYYGDNRWQFNRSWYFHI